MVLLKMSPAQIMAMEGPLLWHTMRVSADLALHVPDMATTYDLEHILNFFYILDKELFTRAHCARFHRVLHRAGP